MLRSTGFDVFAEHCQRSAVEGFVATVYLSIHVSIYLSTYLFANIVMHIFASQARELAEATSPLGLKWRADGGPVVGSDELRVRRNWHQRRRDASGAQRW